MLLSKVALLQQLHGKYHIIFSQKASEKPTTYKPLLNAVLEHKIALKQILCVQWENVFVLPLHNELSHCE